MVNDIAMDIQELIESIAANSKEFGRFYFTVIDTNSPMRAVAVDCRGDIVVSQYDCNGTYSETKFIHKTEDAIAFLFDADIHLWQLVSCDIQQGSGCYGRVTTWNITLRR